MKAQLEALCNQPHKFRGTSEESTIMVNRMKAMLAEDRMDLNDLMDICLGYDLNLRSILTMAYTPYGIIFEDTIKDCIEKDDLKSLLFFTSVSMIQHHGKFHTVNNTVLREHNEINEEIMDQLRAYLLKKGYPLNARNVSNPHSFFKVKHLKDADCDEETLMKYVFLAGGIRYPFTDQVSIAFFNQLDNEDKDYILTQLLNAYRSFRYEKVDATAFIVEDDTLHVGRIIQKADFDALSTDSPKKDELIALQEKILS